MLIVREMYYFCALIFNFMTHNSLKNLLAAVALLCAVMANADIPAGYYSSINGKAEADLKTALFNLINPHSQVSSYTALPSYFQKTDVYPNSTRWWDMYSDIPLYAPNFNGLNREHSFPKSWWGGSTTIPVYVDLFHLYPSERDANMAKSNYPLGVVIDNGSQFNNTVSMVGKGQNSGGAAYVFEPANEYKGDFARTYFYVVTAYQNLTWKYTYMAQNGNYPTLQPWAIELLLKWHRQDPVSEKEILRNEAVYKIQNNRNPFIDHPELAEYIWGNMKGQIFNDTSDPSTGTPTLISPVQGMVLDFGQVALGNSATAQLFFKGEKLKGYFEFTIYNGNYSFFKSSASTLSAVAANSTNGAWITITYTPTEIGEHTSRFLVQEGGLEGSLGIELRGECLPRPTLSTLTANAASEITREGYTANWDIPSEPVDYYVITLHRYKGTTVTTETVEAENPAWHIDGFEDYDKDVYSVQSSRLGVLSAPSNEITVAQPAGIDAVNADTPFTVESYPELLRVRCSGTQTHMTVYDLTGRMVMCVDEVTDGYEFQLPAGMYFVRTDTHFTPVKVVAQ